MVAHTLILALERQTQADLCEFEASLLYKEFQTSQGFLFIYLFLT